MSIIHGWATTSLMRLGMCRVLVDFMRFAVHALVVTTVESSPSAEEYAHDIHSSVQLSGFWIPCVLGTALQQARSLFEIASACRRPCPRRVVTVISMVEQSWGP